MTVTKNKYPAPDPCLPDRQSQTPISRAVVLLSGGLDSSTVLAIAKKEGHELYAMSFDYNQRHRIELESAKLVADALNVRKHLIVSFDLREIGGSALTSEMEVPKDRDELSVTGNKLNKPLRYASRTTHNLSQIPVTYVPARNTIFLSFALGWAEVLGAANIFIGANAIDYSGYPDCRPEYLKAFGNMANLATKASVEGKLKFLIRAPLLSKTKSEIIKKGIQLGLDYALTWSCYDPQPEKERKSEARSQKSELKKFRTSALPHFRTDFAPCGLCDSCRLREKGFKEAGIKDPLLVY